MHANPSKGQERQGRLAMRDGLAMSRSRPVHADDNTATVEGDDSVAQAGPGDRNTASVHGNDSTAQAAAPEGCTVTVEGDGQTDSCS